MFAGYTISGIILLTNMSFTSCYRMYSTLTKKCAIYYIASRIQQRMLQECRLCGEASDLQKSHIIPNFVIRWMKKTGATPFLRQTDDPDTRIQDYKEELLCENCEQKFGKWESEFASKIFYPFIRDEESEFRYDNWLKKFIISISWRLIVCKRTDIESFDTPHREELREIEEEWRHMLNGSKHVSSEECSHYMCFSRGIDTVETDASRTADFYFDRALDAIPVTSFGTYIYFKFPQMFFVSSINPREFPGLSGAEVGEEGVIESQQTIGLLWRIFLQARIDLATENSASEQEREKILSYMENNHERLMQSESLKTFARRRNKKRKRHNPLKYINQKCPLCGFEHQVVITIAKIVSQDQVESLNQSENIAFAASVMPNSHNFNIFRKNSPQDALVISTSDRTLVLTLYENIGYIIEESVLHEESDDPKEVGRMVYEQIKMEFDEAVSRFLDDIVHYQLDLDAY